MAITCVVGVIIFTQLQEISQIAQLYTIQLSAAQLPVHEKIGEGESSEVPLQQQQEVDGCFDSNYPIPTFIIAGVQKGGTTALSAILEQVPGLFKSSKPEGHMFDRKLFNFRKEWKNAGNDTEAQTRLICNARKTYRSIWDKGEIQKYRTTSQRPVWTFEKTPAYFSKPESVLSSLPFVAPWTKVILILRNPVDRAYSFFAMEYGRHKKPKWNESHAFESLIDESMDKLRVHHAVYAPRLLNEYLNNSQAYTAANFARVRNLLDGGTHVPPHRFADIVPRGFYALQLDYWLAQNYSVANDNLLVLNLDTFQSQPEAVLQRVLDFVGYYSPHNLSNGVLTHHYRAIPKDPFRKAPPLNPVTRRYLENVYRQFNEMLVGRLGEEWRDVWKPGASDES